VADGEAGGASLGVGISDDARTSSISELRIRLGSGRGTRPRDLRMSCAGTRRQGVSSDRHRVRTKLPRSSCRRWMARGARHDRQGSRSLGKYVGISSLASIGDLPTCLDQPITRRPFTLLFSGRGTRPIPATTVSVHAVKSDGDGKRFLCRSFGVSTRTSTRHQFTISPISDSHRALRLGQVPPYRPPTGQAPAPFQSHARATPGAGVSFHLIRTLAK
jgi:hypothetical protein